MALFLWLLLCAFIYYAADSRGRNKWGMTRWGPNFIEKHSQR